MTPVPYSLYVHVPFCVVKCGYCDFNSYVVEDLAAHDRFLAALDAELRLRWSADVHGEPVSIFFGGGTPSLLDEERLARLFEIVDRRVPLARCAEVSMEANPESFTVDKARIARAAGVTRVSIGVQSFHAHHLEFLDRAHGADGAERAFAAARDGGFDNVSIDLMFGIPGETVDEWRLDLDRALRLRPDHLSCYNLTFEPGTRLTIATGEQGRDRDPTTRSVDRAMFEWTRAATRRGRLRRLRGQQLCGARVGRAVHNDHYWLQGNYVGVGPGGCSGHQDGVRVSNLKPLACVERRGPCGLAGRTGSAETLRPMQRAAEALWLGDPTHRMASMWRPIAARICSSMCTRGVRAGDRSGHRQRGPRWLTKARQLRLWLEREGLLLADQVGGDYLEVAIDD